MKKVFLAVVLLTFLSSFLVAEDALVMPKGLARLFIVPTYGFADNSYDKDGNKVSGDAGISFFNLGFAFEFGVADWISGALQWAPGVTLSSKIADNDKMNMNDTADLFIGAKLQFVGPKAPVQSDRFRVAFAPGILVPLGGADFTKETQNMLAGKDATLANIDKHAFAAGWRVYFDVIANENFFVNLFNETLFYLQKKNLNNVDPTWGGAYAASSGAIGKGEIDYRHRTIFEVEPVFSFFPSSKGTAGNNLQVVLPLRYTINPTPDYSFEDELMANTILTMGGSSLDEIMNKNKATALTLTPGILFFWRDCPLPLQFRIQYGIPLYITNGLAMNTITFQVRAYFKLF